MKSPSPVGDDLQHFTARTNDRHRELTAAQSQTLKISFPKLPIYIMPSKSNGCCTSAVKPTRKWPKPKEITQASGKSLGPPWHCKFFLQILKRTSRSAIADKPCCSECKLWQKCKCKEHASNIALSYTAKDISKCWTV